MLFNEKENLNEMEQKDENVEVTSEMSFENEYDENVAVKTPNPLIDNDVEIEVSKSDKKNLDIFLYVSISILSVLLLTIIILLILGNKGII